MSEVSRSERDMRGTRGSSVLSSACDVLEMSLVRGVGGVCDMCMGLAWGGVGGVGSDRRPTYNPTYKTYSSGQKTMTYFSTQTRRHAHYSLRTQQNITHN